MLLYVLVVDIVQHFRDGLAVVISIFVASFSASPPWIGSRNLAMVAVTREGSGRVLWSKRRVNKKRLSLLGLAVGPGCIVHLHGFDG